jgi:hypothetical protein
LANGIALAPRLPAAWQHAFDKVTRAGGAFVRKLVK